MGKAALFAVGAFIIMGALYGMNSNSGMLATTERISEHQYATLARNVAIAGYNHVRQELVDDFKPNFISGSYENGYYTAVVQTGAASGTLAVEVVGRVFDGSGIEVRHHIYATFGLDATSGTGDEGIGSEVPLFMQYALLTEDDLTLNGTVDITPIEAVGMDGSAYNANIHTNGSLRVNGNVEVHGYGSYKDGLTLNPNKPDRFFKPFAPMGEALVKRVPEGVDIPTDSFDPEQMKDQFPPDRITGDVKISGRQDFKVEGATRENPYIWYVDGSLTVNGNVKIDGYAIFLVRDDIILNGNVEVLTSDGPSETKLGLYAGNDVTLNGNVSVLWGQVFAKNRFVLNGRPQINGNVVAGGQAVLNGTPRINYFPASPALTRYWQDPDGSGVQILKLLSYSERDHQSTTV